MNQDAADFGIAMSWDFATQCLVAGIAMVHLMLERIAKARAKARAHVWKLIEDTPTGFPWLVIAGKAPAGWLVIDMDATLVFARSDKEGATPKRLPPGRRATAFILCGTRAANTRESAKSPRGAATPSEWCQLSP